MRPTFRMLTCVFMLLLSSHESRSADWMFTAAGSRQFPKITKALDGTIVTTYGVRNGRDAQIYVVQSSDHGRTWSAPSQAGTVLYGTIGLQRQPYAVKSSDGSLHCVWENVKSGNQLAIFHTRSTDNGATWTTPKPVVDVNDGRSQDFSSVATGPDGQVYVSFLSADVNDLDGLQHVLVTRSTDIGVTWQAPVRADVYVDGGACECCQQNIAVGPRGEIAVAFRTNINNRRDIALAVSNDGGQTFTSPTFIQNGTWTIDGCPSTGPSLQFDTIGMVHLAWRDSRDAVGRNVAYYAQYVPGTRVVPQNVDLSSAHAETGEYPSVAVSPDGDHIAVIFESSRGVQITRSDDGGATFACELVDPISIQATSAHVVWTNEGVPYAAWQSTREGHFDVLTSRDQVTSVGGNREQGTGNREEGTGNRELGTWDMMGRLVDMRYIYRPTLAITMYADGHCEQRLLLPR